MTEDPTRVYVYCDASWRDGRAGIAYESAHLGSDSSIVSCQTSTEAELLALIFAMEACEFARLKNVVFRTDCTSAAHPRRGRSDHPLRPLRERAAEYLSRNGSGWSVQQVSRNSNRVANGIAGRARKSAMEIGDVTVTVNASVARDLIARAGIAATTDDRWRLSGEGDSANINAALCVALVTLARDQHVGLLAKSPAGIAWVSARTGRPVIGVGGDNRVREQLAAVFGAPPVQFLAGRASQIPRDIGRLAATGRQQVPWLRQSPDG